MVAIVGFIAVGELLLGIGLVYYVKFVHTPSPYRIVALAGVLEISKAGGHRRYQYTRTQTIVANRPDLRLVRFRSHWTAVGGDGKSKCVNNQHVLLDPGRPEGGPSGHTFRWIYLGQPLARGSRVDVALTLEFDDAERQMVPYYRESLEEGEAAPIRITVRFDRDDEPKVITCRRWRRGKGGSGERQVAETLGEPLRVAGKGLSTVEFVFQATKPRPDSAYGIEWEWLD